MSSSDGYGSQGNGSGNEEKVARSDDPEWLHRVDNRQKTECKYCVHMLNAAAREGTGVKAPTDYDIMNKYLKSEKEELESYIDSLKRQWPAYRVTIMCDG